jgi:hypothetical protein
MAPKSPSGSASDSRRGPYDPRRMRAAIATFTGMPDEFADDQLLLELLRARGVDPAYAPWDDPDVDWGAFPLVFAKSPWDYTFRHDEFLAWIDRVGDRLENKPEVIRWNSDKRYLGDLGRLGVPVVSTDYVSPGDEAPEIDREVVVKPTVSAGARDTGRFSPRSAEEGRRLIERITGGGGVAMVQPFLEAVEESGETAIVTIDGEVSHVLRKRPVLGADETAPMRDDELAAAEAMYDPDLVGPGEADADELTLAETVLAAMRERFGRAPLVARVDMLRGDDGEPVLLELEAIEPNLYFEHAPGAAERLADAIVRRL